MTHRNADRVFDTSTTTGTGNATVSGTASPTYITFSQIPGITVGDTFYYGIVHQTSNEYETGLGTWQGSNTFSRTVVFQSSNSNSLVNFSAGTKDVFCCLPASQAADLQVYPQASVSGAITIDRNNGACQRLSITGNVTSVTISNFGAAGSLCKLVLEIWNTGAFTFAWPASLIWPDGTEEPITSGAGAKDVFLLYTMDGGTTVYAALVGKNHS